MQTRYMERTKSMKERGKRGLEDGGSQESEKKRPALASVIVEALKVDSLQKLFSSLEPILRRVVSEEVERALAKLGPASLAGRSSPKHIEGPDGRNLQLLFRSRLSLPLFTGGKVEGEQGAAIHAVLVDANTGHVVTSGPESSLKLDVVVLEGDFDKEDEEGWSEEEFECHILKEREGKRPLLTGDLQVSLKEGVGTLGELSFTDNSSWVRSRKFRLGLKVAPGYEGIRIREARTEAFTVKDHRGELYKKHYPPALDDEVWRLEKIGKDGSFHKKLNAAGMRSVEDFLRLLVKDPQKLRNILGNSMSNRMWEALVEHAKTCVLSGKLYVYHHDSTRTASVVFNNIYELSGLIVNEQFYPADSLSDNQKVFVDSLVKKAYENWGQVVEYDGKSLLNFKQNKKSNLQSGPNNCFHSLDNQLQFSRLPVSIHSEAPSVDQNMLAGAGGFSSYHDRFFSQTHLTTPVDSAVTQPTHAGYDSGRVGLALAPPQSSSTIQMANPFDEFLSVEDIRMGTHELLENEDMQHLLRIFSLGGHAAANGAAEDGHGTSYVPHSAAPGFNGGKDGARSGKAVAGWLKIKAAMRWGIFVRRKAAEKRARIEELDDE